MSRPWAVITLGTAAGEAALAAAFVTAAVSRGHRVLGWAGSERYASQLAQAGAAVELLRSPSALTDSLADVEVVACATSLTCFSLLGDIGAASIPLVTLESSWMPWTTRASDRLARIDRFLVSMPPAVFAAGLGENRGRFEVPSDILRRVRPVGWFAPSLPRGDGPSTVLVYFGRGYDPSAFICRDVLGPAIATVAARRPDVRWRYIGPAGLAVPAFVEQHSDWVAEATLAKWHAEADLVVCHHGQVTIGRAAATGARVLTLTDGTIFRPNAAADWADFEVHAFARSGTVEAVFGAAPVAAIARRMEDLLESGRAEPWGGNGADVAVEEVTTLLRCQQESV